MLDHFLQHSLAQIDDLTELKVSLIALRLLEHKQSETASVTASELSAHPSLLDGLGFAPQIALNAALQRAVARGTLLRCESASFVEARYFHNNAASRRLIATLQQSTHSAHIQSTSANGTDLLSLLSREIERLEGIGAYSINSDEKQLLDEWTAQGYSQGELVQAVRIALGVPRMKGTPPRGLSACVAQIASQPPAQPSEYYQVVILRTQALPDEIIAFRELTGRRPNGREYQLVRAAVGLFGSNATIQLMRRQLSDNQVDVEALLGLLAEQQEAELALAREKVLPDMKTQELLRLYESSFGLPPTSRVAQDILVMAVEIPDLLVWQRVFEYAIQRNKRDWSYVRKLLQNPSPSLFEPEPVNETARFAFKEYKRRVSFGVLDSMVAQEINEVAQQVTDIAIWQQAIDKAARTNALNWNYIKKVLTGSSTGTGEDKDGRRKQVSYGRGRAVSRRQQVEDSTEAEREAARERARQRIEERAKRNPSKDKPSASE